MGFRIAAINGMGSVTESPPGTFNTTGMRDAGVMNVASNFIANPGVVGLPGTSLGVSATSPATNQVQVAAGAAYVENDAYTVGGAEVKFWEVNSDDVELVTNPANASGNPRIDLICIAVDPLQTPGDDGEPNVSLEVVQGTPAGSPVAPSVPAKHTVLAQIAVANGFSTISGGNITDRRTISYINGRYVIWPNNVPIMQYDSTGVPRAVANVNASNRLVVGDSNLSGAFLRNAKLLVSAFQSGAQNIPTSSSTNLTLGGENFDPGNNFASGTFTAPVTGYYFAVGQFTFSSPTDQMGLNVLLRVNTTDTKRNNFRASGTSTQGTFISGILNLTAGDTVNLRVFHTKGSDLAVVANALDTYLDIFFIGSA